jgi:choline kinase
MNRKAVILAAGSGTRLRPLTNKLPKCLVPVGDTPLLGRMLEPLRQVGVSEVVVVTGYMSGAVESYVRDAVLPCRCVYNPRYDEANNYYSLLVAREELDGHPFLKLDGDVIFDPKVLERVMEGPGDIRLGVDVREELGGEEMKAKLDDEGRVLALSKKISPKESAGESMGVEWISPAGFEPVFDTLHQMADQGLDDEYYEYAYDQLARRGCDVRAADISGLRVTEIDDLEDLKRAEALFS